MLQSPPAAILAANRDLPLDDPRLATGQAVCKLSDICAAAWRTGNYMMNAIPSVHCETHLL